jgi:Zn-dependent peptidase ImmA (M78 family)
MAKLPAADYRADLAALARHLKADITYGALSPELVGKITPNASGAARWLLLLNEQDATEQKHFTAAVLLGHVMWASDFLKRGVEFSRDYTASVLICGRSHKRALQFAKIHLTPEPLLRATAKDHAPADLAQMFGVPISLIRTRLDEIGLEAGE